MMTTPVEKLQNLLSVEILDTGTVREISQVITSSEITVLQLVENLQSDLLNLQSERRLRAVSLIARVLENLLQSGTVVTREIELLTEFFCSKLKDHHSLLPATLQGIHALSSTPYLPSGLSKLIVRSMFQDIHCQSQLQSDRRRIYYTIKNFLTFKLEELQELGSEFVFGFIQAVDQERDPRNLLIVFSLIPIVSQYFQLEPFTEELFEVFSCYFPIDFSAADDDPYGITKEQLSDGLRSCLASGTHFADYCLPLLFDKLESDLVAAKVEALKTLELCCQKYKSAQLDNWIAPLWTCIRREILINVNSDELEHTALDALTSLARAFTDEDNQINSPAFSNVLESIIKECKEHLCEPERRLMTPSSYVLLALCAGSPPVCHSVMTQVIPLLLEQYKIRTQATPRQFILHTLNKMIHAGLYGFTELNVKESGVHQFASDLIQLYLDIVGEKDVELQRLSLQGLSRLIGVRLNQSEKIVQTLIDLLDSSVEGAEDISNEIGLFFQQSSEQDEEWAVHHLLPKLFDMIHSGSGDKAFLVMKNLSALSQIQPFVIPRLMTLLDQHETQHVAGLLQVLARFSQNNGDLKVFQHVREWALKTHKTEAQEQDPPSTLHITCAILRNLSSSLSPIDAASLVNHQVDEYLNNCSTWGVMIMEAILGSLDVKPDKLITARLCKELAPIALHHAREDVRVSACRLTAALINKFPEDSQLESVLESLDLPKENIDRSSVNANQLILFIWITKGLVMRSYSKVDRYIQKMVDFLTNPSHGFLVADGFKTILSDTEECLNAGSHANIKLMYRQRFFQEAVPRLLDLYRNNDSESNHKAPVFAAIANQLAFIPQGVLLAHMKTLVPLLIQCLAVEQSDQLIMSTIQALLALMTENTTAMLDYIDNLVSRLLILAKNGKSMHVRRLALKGLSELRNAPQIVLLPLRSQVIIQLVPCLSDKKRLVRREAALARHKWVMLGQPGAQ